MKASRSDSLWPLSFDQESGDMGVGLLPDKLSNHKYFPWHKVKQARTSGATGVSFLSEKPAGRKKRFQGGAPFGQFLVTFF